MSKPGDIYVRNGKKPVTSAFASKEAGCFVGVKYDGERRMVSMAFVNRNGKTAFEVELAAFLMAEYKEAERFAEAVRTGLAVVIDRVLADYHREQVYQNDHFEDDNH